jgi:hypothetical protein
MSMDGFDIDDALPALNLLWELRQIDDNEVLKPKKSTVHPLVSLPVLRHPFKK